VTGPTKEAREAKYVKKQMLQKGFYTGNRAPHLHPSKLSEPHSRNIVGGWVPEHDDQDID
jgi:hypothetical protein